MPGRTPASPQRLPAAGALAIGMLGCLLPGCARDRGTVAARDGAAWIEGARASAGEARRRFEKRAGEVRDDLEAARVAAEAALRRGARLLEDAARDGGQAAEIWARLIQDRMMRLESAVKALSGAEEHADS